MEDILSISFFISVVYFIIRFIEMNFIEKEPKPIKIILKDTAFVFISVNLGKFLISQIFGATSLNIGGDNIVNKAVDAFTGEPGF
tara:strand:- start:1247 stop:1501 length:255 start_codon:yes stop_codon:yes gene_type:complete